VLVLHTLTWKTKGKSNVKVHAITCHGGTEGEWNYSSLLSLISALDGVDQRHAPEKKAGTNFKGGCVSARDGLEGYRKLRLDRDSIPGSLSP